MIQKGEERLKRDFQNPEISMSKFEIEDIMTTSPEGGSGEDQMPDDEF